MIYYGDTGWVEPNLVGSYVNWERLPIYSMVIKTRIGDLLYYGLSLIKGGRYVKIKLL